MSILSKIFGQFSSDYTPAIDPTDNDAIDAPALTLMLLNKLDTSGKGYRGEVRLQIGVFLIEEQLQDNSIAVNRYEWTASHHKKIGAKVPSTWQFNTDLRRGLSMERDKPVLSRLEARTFGNSLTNYYKTTEYTDAYIDEYFRHTSTDRATVEQIVTTVHNLIADTSVSSIAHNYLPEEHTAMFH